MKKSVHTIALALTLALALACGSLASCRTAQDVLNMPINLVNKLTPGPLPNLPKIRLPRTGGGAVKTIR